MMHLAGHAASICTIEKDEKGQKNETLILHLQVQNDEDMQDFQAEMVYRDTSQPA